MAREIPGFSFTLIAGEDLTDSQFCAVDIDGDGKAALPTQGARAIGVVQNNPDIGEAATVVVTGVVKVQVGLTGVSAGDSVTVDDDGTIIQPTSGDRAIGVSLEDTAAGLIGTVLLLNGQATVSTS